MLSVTYGGYLPPGDMALILMASPEFTQDVSKVRLIVGDPSGAWVIVQVSALEILEAESPQRIVWFTAPKQDFQIGMRVSFVSE